MSEIEEIRRRLSNLATVRSHFWRTGDALSARWCTAELAREYARLRTVTAQSSVTRALDEPEPVDRWLATCERRGSCTIADAHVSYTSWLDAQDEMDAAGTVRRFTSQLRARGFEFTRTKESRLIVGLRVTEKRHSPHGISNSNTR